MFFKPLHLSLHFRMLRLEMVQPVLWFCVAKRGESRRGQRTTRAARVLACSFSFCSSTAGVSCGWKRKWSPMDRFDQWRAKKKILGNKFFFFPFFVVFKRNVCRCSRLKLLGYSWGRLQASTLHYTQNYIASQTPAGRAEKGEQIIK